MSDCPAHTDPGWRRTIVPVPDVLALLPGDQTRQLVRRVPRVVERGLALLLRVYHTQHVRREPAAVRGRVVGHGVDLAEREVLEEEAEGVRLGRGELDDAIEDLREERAREWSRGEAAFHVDVLAVAGDVVLQGVEDFVGLLFGHVGDGLCGTRGGNGD